MLHFSTSNFSPTDAETLTRELGGRWYGTYGVARCPAHDDKNPSLSLSNGNDGLLLAKCHAGCTFQAIIEALRHLGFVDTPAPQSRAGKISEDASQRTDRTDTNQNAQWAEQLWNESLPIAGSLAETYLNARGITCDLPDTLRFHAACWHGSTRKRLPVMVARIDGGESFAIHRTYLDSDGSKANVDQAKLMLGSVSGGAVRLSDDPGPLVVAEGIETALSLRCGLLQEKAAVWAALSTSGLKSLRLPDQPHKLIIASDGDDAGRKAANELAERATALGWNVWLLSAPDDEDWNDVLQSGGDSIRPREPVPFKAEGPQPLVREIAPGAPYPVEHLGPLQPVVEAVQGMTQAPVAIPAASALAVASLAVQGFANVATLAGPRPLSLYIMTIARSGERKSSCDAPVMAALREHEMEQAKSHREAVISWENKHALWKGERNYIVKKGKGEKRVAAQNDLEALGPEPAAPPTADRTVTEPTFEGLTRLFAQGQPSLGIFSDEGGQFLGGHAMNSDNRQKTLAALNDLWQGNPIRRTRAGDGHLTLYGRRLAMHLMVQPSVARAFMSDPLAADTGFLPRFLICEPPSTIGTRMNASARKDDGALWLWEQQIGDIFNTQMPMDSETRELEPRLLDLSPESRSLLIQFSDAIEATQAPGGDLAHITGFASKTAELAARIAGVLTLVRDLHASEVNARDMADGIALAQFYLTEASRLASAATVSTEIDQADGLRRWLLEKWQEPEIMVRDVLQYGPSPLRESPKARKALNLLEQHGWLIPLDAGTVVRGSSRKEAWQIVRA